MAEILASLSDVNANLPPNVQISNAVDDNLQTDAFRVIRGQLVSIFTPSIINTWVTPETTPEIIRSIAGRLIASKYYANLFSGESSDNMPGHSVDLYNEAIQMLSDIKAGIIVVVDGDGNPISQDNIGPDPINDVHPTDNAPVFTMDRVLS